MIWQYISAVDDTARKSREKNLLHDAFFRFFPVFTTLFNGLLITSIRIWSLYFIL